MSPGTTNVETIKSMQWAKWLTMRHLNTVSALEVYGTTLQPKLLLTCQLCMMHLNVLFADFFPLRCHLLLLLSPFQGSSLCLPAPVFKGGHSGFCFWFASLFFLKLLHFISQKAMVVNDSDVSSLIPTRQKGLNDLLSPSCWSKEMQKNQNQTQKTKQNSQLILCQFLWQHSIRIFQIFMLIIKSDYSF